MILFYTLIVMWFVWYLWSQRKFYWASFHMEGPPAMPFIGNALLMTNMDKLFGVFVKLRRTYKKKLMRIWLGTRFFIYTENPDVIEEVLNHPKCLDKGESYQYLSVLGNGLITLNGDIWKLHRKLMNPSFQYNIINGFASTFNKHSIKLIEKLNEHADGDTFNLFEPMESFSINLICETTINTSADKTKDITNALHKCLNATVRRLFQAWYRLDIVFRLSSHYNVQKTNMKVIFSTIKEIVIAKKEEILEKELEIGDDGSNILIDRVIRLAKNNLWTDHDVISEVNTVVLAGYETTAQSISYICLALALYPEYQQQLFEEIKSVFPNKNCEVTLDQVKDLQFLDLVVKEGMRLFPPVPFVTRRVTEDIKIDNQNIPAGTEILVCIYKMHRSKEFYNIDNPEEFNPYNFLPENTAGRHPYSYIPFSAGPRNCIGIKYAQLSIKIALVHILRNFSVSTDLKLSALRYRMKITLHLINNHLVRLHRRND